MVKFSDPSRPGAIKCHMLNGEIVVTAYEGKEVIIETAPGERRDPPGRSNRRSAEREPPSPPPPPLVFSGGAGLTVEEQNNIITVSPDMIGRGSSLRIQVPTATSLDLRTMNGRLQVEGVGGEIQAQAVNGTVQVTDVLGPVVAHTVNGNLKAVFVRVPAGKPMSFSSLNGAIDVTFPADLKANLLITTGQGEVYSDFDITLKKGSEPVAEDKRGEGGKYKARLESALSGVINGGGPELRFKTFNGKIYLRKK